MVSTRKIKINGENVEIECKTVYKVGNSTVDTLSELKKVYPMIMNRPEYINGIKDKTVRPFTNKLNAKIKSLLKEKDLEIDRSYKVDCYELPESQKNCFTFRGVDGFGVKISNITVNRNDIDINYYHMKTSSSEYVNNDEVTIKKGYSYKKDMNCFKKLNVNKIAKVIVGNYEKSVSSKKKRLNELDKIDISNFVFKHQIMFGDSHNNDYSREDMAYLIKKHNLPCFYRYGLFMRGAEEKEVSVERMLDYLKNNKQSDYYLKNGEFHFNEYSDNDLF